MEKPVPHGLRRVSHVRSSPFLHRIHTFAHYNCGESRFFPGSPAREGQPLSTLRFSGIIFKRTTVGRAPPNLGGRSKFAVRNLSFWYGPLARWDFSPVGPGRSVMALVGPQQ